MNEDRRASGGEAESQGSATDRARWPGDGGVPAAPAGGSPWGQPTLVPRLGPGMQVGRFRIDSLLGRGGMGEVWKAFDPTRQGPVVVKVLPAQLQENPAEIARIEQSFRRVNALQHQHICPVYDLQNDPRCGHYLVMKYLEGETLAVYRWKYVQSRGSFPSEEAVRLLRPIAEALDYAHREGIIHRDVKPQNILVRPDGADPQLVDFGLAAEIRASVSRVSQNGSDTSGTLAYMAPEQWRGRRQDQRTDQYALAAVAYELLDGEPPFSAADPEVLRLCVLNEAVPACAGVRAEVNAVLAKALGKDPHARYADCVAFMAALGGAGRTGSASLAELPHSPPGDGPAPVAGNSHSSESRLRADQPTIRSSGTAGGEWPVAVAYPASGATGGKGRARHESVLTVGLIVLVLAGAILFRNDLFGTKSSTGTARATQQASLPSTTPAPLSPPPGTSAVQGQPGTAPGVGPATASPPQPTASPLAAAAPTSSVPPSPAMGGVQGGNYKGMKEAIQAQQAARALQGESHHTEVLACAAAEVQEADTLFAVAEQQFKTYHFVEARTEYERAQGKYSLALQQAQSNRQARWEVRSLAQAVQAVREEASKAHAPRQAPDPWKEAEQLATEAQAAAQAGQFLQAKPKLLLAQHKYGESRDRARNLSQAEQARQDFGAEIADPGRAAFDQHGGAAWKALTQKMDEAEKSQDPIRIARAYQEGLADLPSILRKVSDAIPGAATAKYLLDLGGAGVGGLPPGWSASGGGQVADFEGFRVLKSQDARPASLASPPIPIRGDFFLQVDSLAMNYTHFGVTLVPASRGHELTAEFRLVNRGQWLMNIRGSPTRRIEVFPDQRPVSFRLERRGTTFSVLLTCCTRDVVVCQSDRAVGYQSIRLDLLRPETAITGLKVGPLLPREDAASKTKALALSWPLDGAGDVETVASLGREERWLRIPKLELHRDFFLEFSFRFIDRPRFLLTLLGANGARDYSLAFQVHRSPVESDWMGVLPSGESGRASEPSSPATTIRLERQGGRCRLFVGTKMIAAGPWAADDSYQALDLVELQERLDIHALRAGPLAD